MVTSTEKLDEIARKYNNTKDQTNKDLWYKEVKEWANGSNIIKRRVVSVSGCHKGDDGGYIIIGRSRLL